MSRRNKDNGDDGCGCLFIAFIIWLLFFSDNGNIDTSKNTYPQHTPPATSSTP